MSYCRFESEPNNMVYMYATWRNKIVCCSCRLTPKDGWFANKSFDHPQKALDHLLEHKAVGHLTALYAIQRLEKEIEELKAHKRKYGRRKYDHGSNTRAS